MMSRGPCSFLEIGGAQSEASSDTPTGLVTDIAPSSRRHHALSSATVGAADRLVLSDPWISPGNSSPEHKGGPARRPGGLAGPGGSSLGARARRRCRKWSLWCQAAKANSRHGRAVARPYARTGYRTLGAGEPSAAADAGSGVRAWPRWEQNRLSATANAAIFDTALNAKGSGAEG